MTLDHWYEAFASQRKAWCFLILETSNQGEEITAWCIGVGNPMQLIRTRAMGVMKEIRNEELITQLYSELDSLRYEDCTLITLDELTIRILRTQLFLSDSTEPSSLRGLKHLSLMDVMSEHFVDSQIENYRQMSTISRLGYRWEQELETLWNTRKAIGPLIPTKESLGDPL